MKWTSLYFYDVQFSYNFFIQKLLKMLSIISADSLYQKLLILANNIRWCNLSLFFKHLNTVYNMQYVMYNMVQKMTHPTIT